MIVFPYSSMRDCRRYSIAESLDTFTRITNWLIDHGFTPTKDNITFQSTYDFTEEQYTEFKLKFL